MSLEQQKYINTFIPQFLKWTIPSLNLDMSTASNRSFSVMANSVFTDEEPSYLDLDCSHKFLFWATGLKGLMI